MVWISRYYKPSPFCLYTLSPCSSRLPLTWTLEFICKLDMVGKGGTSFPSRNSQPSKIYHPVNHANETHGTLPAWKCLLSICSFPTFPCSLRRLVKLTATQGSCLSIFREPGAGWQETMSEFDYIMHTFSYFSQRYQNSNYNLMFSCFPQ